MQGIMNTSIFGKTTRSKRSARSQKRRRSARRNFMSEQLESRVLLAGDTLAWHNAELPMDTNGDGRITSLDALLVVNELNANGAHDVDASVPAPGLVDVNANGVISPSDALTIINYLNSGQGEPEKVQVRLAVTPTDSFDPVTTLNAGDEFLLRVFVQDIRDEALGVFAAYVDVTYNAELADVDGEVQHCRDTSDIPLSCLAFEYPNGITSPDDPGSVNNVSVDGELNEMGGFSSSLVPLGAAERLLLSVPMVAEDRSGTLTFAGDPSDILPAHEINLFGESVGVLDDEIVFVNTSVQVVGSSTGSLTANADAYNATEDVDLVVDAAAGVLANDDPSAGVTAQLVSNGTNGIVTLAADGSFTYDPADNFNGNDSFTYRTTDGTNESNVATVTIAVAAETDSPIAGNDAYTTVENTPLNISAAEGLLVNDTDPDSTNLIAVAGTDPANGMVVIQSDGSFVYTPNDGFVGTDTFRYLVQDDTTPPLSGIGTVTITVTEDTGNTAPIGVNDSFNALEDITLVIDAPGVLANDTDADDDALSAFIVTQPANGMVTLDRTGALTYVPDADFNGTDTFTYRTTDGALSDTATVLINVAPQDDPPRPGDDLYTTTVDTQLQVSAEDGLLSNDVDVDSDFIRAIFGTSPANGTVIVLSDGSFTYTPNDGFVGTDTFIYQVQDNSPAAPLTAFGNVTIQVVEQGNLAPNAMDDEFTVLEDATLTVTAPGVLGNDTDGDNDDLTAELLTVPANGSVDFSADGSFVYTPDLDFNGIDSFTYRASDGTDSDTATVSIEVTSVNDAPEAENDFYSTPFETVLEVSANGGLLANDTDIDSENLIVSMTTQPANGTLEFDADGSFVYTPDDGFSGTDTFSYVVQDDGTPPVSAFAVATIEVGQPQDLQVAFRVATTDMDGNEITSIAAGESFELRVFVDDITPEPQQGVFAAYLDVEWDPSLAVVTGEPVYSDLYQNGRNFGVADVPGLIDEAGAFDGLSELGGAEQLLFSIPLEASGNGELTFSTNPADILPFGDVLLFELRGDAVSPERIDYGTTTLNVQGPTEPVAVNDTYDVDEGTVLVIPAEDGVLVNDFAPDGGLSAFLVDGPDNGTLDLNADGSFEYEPNEGFVGTDSFTYRALTVGDSSEVATVTITVGEVNPGSISGTVYFDTNNNGILESAEHAFGGVAVTLSRTDSSGAIVETIGTVQSGPDGGYIFRNVDPGSYVVTQEQPAIVIDGIDSIDGVASSTNDTHSVTVGSGANVLDVNFGERGLQPAYFGNSLFFSSTISGGAGIGIGPDGSTSWFCFDTGWDGFRSVTADLVGGGTLVNITAVTLNGDTLVSSVSVTDPLVQVIGNTSNGFLIRLTGASSAYNLQAVSTAAAVDAVFAE